MVWDASAASEGPHTVTAVARDRDGHPATAEVTFLVDRTPPAARLVNPPEGAILRGVVPVEVESTDANGENVGVVRVDGVARGHVLNGSPYRWDTATAADGPHLVAAEVSDRALNVTAVGPVRVVVDNTAPTVAIASPAPGLVAGDLVEITVAAADAMGIAGVQLRAGAAPIASWSVPPYSVSWDTTGLADGTYTLTADAADQAGNTASGSAVTGTALIQFQWTELGSAAPYVQYLVDEANASWTSLTGGTLSWNTRLYPDGVHTLRIRIQDAVGNVGSSEVIHVRVANGAAPTQLLLDSGCESGAPGAWAARLASAFDAGGTPAPNAGQYEASPRGVGAPGTDWVRQGFVVPATATRLTFRYWLQVRTAGETSTVRDRLDVRLVRASGSGVITTLATHSNRDARLAGWVEKSVTLNVSGLRGQAVALAFDGTEDSSGATSFHLDEVRVTWTP